MEDYIAYIVFFGPIICFVIIYLIWEKRKLRKQGPVLPDPDDGSIYVEGVGLVKFEEMSEMVNGDPNEDVKQVKDTMFREDLMQFEGEFLIPGLALNEERRLSIDDAFLYMQELFGEDLVKQKPVLTIHDALFPVEIKDLSAVIPLTYTIAKIMDIDPDDLEIGFFEGDKGADMDLQNGSYQYSGAAGLYYGKNENGKYEVTFSDTLYREPERLIATIAHEFAHIKLLGEERMEENSEEMTDMLPLFYGFGLFNSNSVFKFSGETNRWSTSKLGYLTQVDWAYLFALYLYVRNEKEPEWMQYMNRTIAKDCSFAYNFIMNNPDRVLQVQS